MSAIPKKTLDWSNVAFFLSTLLLTLIAVPIYVRREGLAGFQIALFFLFFVLTGLSITLGYHRLFSHRSFQASWPVRFFTLFFGAGAFENSALCWAADHRRHHKFVDHEEDPYDATKGFFHAHIGWILYRSGKPLPGLEHVQDLQQDRLVQWQHRHYRLLGLGVGFALPALLAGWWGGWPAAWGGFLIAGVARLVFVQQFTFFINSLCHTIGRQPYSDRCTARDSAFMALFTFGEGYHNFHHAFQHDYRNGIKPWQFDPTKWSVWMLHKLGLVRRLRRVPVEKVLLAEITEQQRQLATKLKAHTRPLADYIHSQLQTAQLRLQQTFQHWEELETAYCKALEKRLEDSRERLAELKREFRAAQGRFHAAIRDWREAHRLVQAHFAAA
jgi:stearoyl-CoA desaturase (Delta-9 desaturase)